MRRFLKSEKGNVLPVVAVMLPVLILLGALVLDIGRAYVASQKLQSILDAAALAGANTGVTINDGVNPPYAVIPNPDGPNAATNLFYENYNTELKPYVDHSKTSLVINPEGSANLSNGKIHLVGTIEWKMWFGSFVKPFLGKDTIKITRDSWATVRPST